MRRICYKQLSLPFIMETAHYTSMQHCVYCTVASCPMIPVAPNPCALGYKEAPERRSKAHRTSSQRRLQTLKHLYFMPKRCESEQKELQLFFFSGKTSKHIFDEVERSKILREQQTWKRLLFFWLKNCGCLLERLFVLCSGGERRASHLPHTDFLAPSRKTLNWIGVTSFAPKQHHLTI